VTREDLMNGEPPRNFCCPHGTGRKRYCQHAVVSGDGILTCSLVDLPLALADQGWSQGFCFRIAFPRYLQDLRKQIETGNLPRYGQLWDTTPIDCGEGVSA